MYKWKQNDDQQDTIILSPRDIHQKRRSRAQYYVIDVCNCRDIGADADADGMDRPTAQGERASGVPNESSFRRSSPPPPPFAKRPCERKKGREERELELALWDTECREKVRQSKKWRLLK